MEEKAEAKKTVKKVEKKVEKKEEKKEEVFIKVRSSYKIKIIFLVLYY